jgi:predicted GNAT family acetyltransferase
VYTPLEYRKRGYASGLTAALTEMLQQEYHANVMLFAEKLNRTSNALYQSLGFEIKFESAVLGLGFES